MSNILRIELDRYWNLSQFIKLFSTFQNIYAIHYALKYRNRFSEEIVYAASRRIPYVNLTPALDESSLYELRDWHHGSIVEEEFLFSNDSRISNPMELSVRGISYASPGFTDLVGIGKIVEQLKDFAIEYLKIKEQRRLTDITIEKGRLAIERERYNFSKEKIKDLKSYGLSPKECIRVARTVNNQMRQLDLFVETEKVSQIRLLSK